MALTQYSYLFNALKLQFPGLVDQAPLPQGAKLSVFQFVAAPIQETLTQEFFAWSRANAASSQLDGYYVPGLATTIEQSYKTFVNSMVTPQGKANDAWRQIDTVLQHEYDQKASIVVLAHAKFLADPDTTKGIFDNWLKQPFGLGSVWADQLNPIQAKIDDNVAQQAKIVAALDSPFKAVIDAVNNATEIDLTGSNPDRNGLQVNLSPDFAATLALWDGKGASDAPDFDQKWTATTQLTSTWTEIREHTDHSCFQTTTTQEAIAHTVVEDISYEFHVTAVGCQLFEIKRGDWFDADAFNFQAFVQGGGFTADNFIGPNGSLRLIPTGLLYMYKPNVTVTMTTKTWEKVKAALATGSVSFFGLEFDLTVANAMTTTEVGSNTQVVFDSGSNTKAQPMLLGVVSQSFVAAQPQAAVRAVVEGHAPPAVAPAPAL